MSENDLVITRRRKKYKFAKFNKLGNCFQLKDWINSSQIRLLKGKKVIIEIGAGSALFLVSLAKLHPENFYIAVDIKSDRLYRGAKQATEEKIKNIVFIRSDIWQLTEIISKNSVDEIWLTFSDPYPSKSDARHRLTHPRFLEMYKNILRSNSKSSQLHFKTDSETLFGWSLEQFKENGWDIKNISRDLHNSDLPDEYKIMTTYEERFVSEGMVIYFADIEQFEVAE